jgi:hypothetical protein
MCKYCEMDDWVGENLKLDRIIDGKNQEFEVYILDNIKAESKQIFVNGTHTELEIIINFCPICGAKL